MGVREFCHFFAAAHFWFGCYYDWNYVILPKHLQKMDDSIFSSKLKFLTYWNALLQGLFFTVCLINDLIGSNEPQPKKVPFFRILRDRLLSGLVFPISMFVALTFWGLYFIDRELIFPKAIDPYFPSWLNHLMHTNIALFLLTEVVTSFRRYPTRKEGLTLLASVMLTYLVWIHVIHHQTGYWVYPVLEVLNFPMRLVFFVGMLVLLVVLYVSGEKLNNTVWKSQLKKTNQKVYN